MSGPRGLRRLLAVVCIGVLGGPRVVAADPWPPSPGRPRAVLFGLEAAGERFVYVLDRSASMGRADGKPLAAAKRELLASLEAIGDDRQFHVIFYNERLQVFAPQGHLGRPAFADGASLRAVRRFVDGVDASGGTGHCQALAAALRLSPDAVFLLTDADENDDLTEAEFVRLSRSLGRTRCLVIQFGGDEGHRSPRLARLADESGGRYRVLGTAGD